MSVRPSALNVSRSVWRRCSTSASCLASTCRMMPPPIAEVVLDGALVGRPRASEVISRRLTLALSPWLGEQPLGGADQRFGHGARHRCVSNPAAREPASQQAEADPADGRLVPDAVAVGRTEVHGGEVGLRGCPAQPDAVVEVGLAEQLGASARRRGVRSWHLQLHTEDAVHPSVRTPAASLAPAGIHGRRLTARLHVDLEERAAGVTGAVARPGSLLVGLGRVADAELVGRARTGAWSSHWQMTMSPPSPPRRSGAGRRRCPPRIGATTSTNWSRPGARRSSDRTTRRPGSLKATSTPKMPLRLSTTGSRSLATRAS